MRRLLESTAHGGARLGPDPLRDQHLSPSSPGRTLPPCVCRAGHSDARRYEPRCKGVCRGAGPTDPGVLVLSKFAGAAQQLSAALIVNPKDNPEVAEAIRDALHMGQRERVTR